MKVNKKMIFRDLYKKYKSIVFYAIFGVLTTIINVVVYWLLVHLVEFDVLFGTVIAWIAAVSFAYVTNRKWVFYSEVYTTMKIVKEIMAFFTCRITTGVIDFTCMFIFVEVFHFNDIIIKVVANVLVIILNYVASRLIVFRTRGGE